ncbi:hypothetical protein E2C01_071800 [Portunus trituberculatus]|uniref:Uncharacterized protein n=1 Tax=Portunus trituberculatus TaxID=210409 RepID=A0A5B7I8Y9_PORTR|nr:hypothetical protein [Portunus trituberculatus]
MRSKDSFSVPRGSKLALVGFRNPICVAPKLQQLGERRVPRTGLCFQCSQCWRMWERSVTSKQGRGLTWQKECGLLTCSPCNEISSICSCAAPNLFSSLFRNSTRHINRVTRLQNMANID